MIVVIDYNVGNVRSVCNAFVHIGCDVKLSRAIRDIESACGLVLPGVAAFGYAVNALGDLAEPIKDAASSGKPLLGICVGHQLLFDRSTEYGTHFGLGLVGGDVVPIPAGRVIPHMGWNLVNLPADIDLFAGLPAQKHFYIAHSFYADVTDSKAKIAYTDYGFNLPAAVQKQNIYGTQFHPEKSGKAGLKLLKNFAEICNPPSPRLPSSLKLRRTGRRTRGENR
ncbi:MAG: imidazole glycerol phosphate synthase subunit HisH [Sedimentisphaerales bacterium]|nr:imidazole glycerol phosphate synthase subunit HisH [Sedimentisphaerales bacterium]